MRMADENIRKASTQRAKITYGVEGEAVDYNNNRMIL